MPSDKKFALLNEQLKAMNKTPSDVSIESFRKLDDNKDYNDLIGTIKDNEDISAININSGYQPFIEHVSSPLQPVSPKDLADRLRKEVAKIDKTPPSETSQYIMSHKTIDAIEKLNLRLKSPSSPMTPMTPISPNKLHSKERNYKDSLVPKTNKLVKRKIMRRDSKGNLEEIEGFVDDVGNIINPCDIE